MIKPHQDHPPKTSLQGGFKPAFSPSPRYRPIYDNALDYSDLKFIHIPQDLKAQRAIADKGNFFSKEIFTISIL